MLISSLLFLLFLFKSSLKLQWGFGIDSFWSIKVPLAVQDDFPVHSYILIFGWKFYMYCVHTILLQKEQRLVNYFFCLENILEPCTYSSSSRFSWSSTVLFSKFTYMEIDLWVLSNILASYLENWFFTKIFYHKELIAFASVMRLVFFILWICCALKVYLPFVVMKIVKIQDLRLPRNKLFYQKYLLIKQSCYIT